MNAASDFLPALPVLDQAGIAWLLDEGVPPLPGIAGEEDVLRLALGSLAHDGIFEPDPDGERHIAIAIRTLDDDLIDVATWLPRSDKLGSFLGRAWALGQEAAENPSLGFAGAGLMIHRSPIEWLRAGREGVVVIRADEAAHRLRRLPRLAVGSVGEGRKLRRALAKGFPEITVRRAA